MTKYSTGSNDDDPSGSDSDEPTKQIRINISEWLKKALDQIVQQSGVGAREAIRQPLEYAVIQWNREFERDNAAFDVPGQHIWEPEFRCIECKSSNKFLFRELQDKDGSSPVLCLNCEHTMSKEGVTKLFRAAEIQDMEPYILEKEGAEIRHEYEGKFRTPMRFECRDCKVRDLILPDPDEVDSLICPRCGNEGRIINQVQGPVVSGFEKYPPDRYHSEPAPEPVGQGISAGEYDQLEKAYRDAYER